MQASSAAIFVHSGKAIICFPEHQHARTRKGQHFFLQQLHGALFFTRECKAEISQSGKAGVLLSFQVVCGLSDKLLPSHGQFVGGQSLFVYAIVRLENAINQGASMS